MILYCDRMARQSSISSAMSGTWICSSCSCSEEQIPIFRTGSHWPSSSQLFLSLLLMVSNQTGTSPLSMASTSGFSATVAVLLNNGADPNLPDNVPTSLSLSPSPSLPSFPFPLLICRAARLQYIGRLEQRTVRSLPCCSTKAQIPTLETRVVGLHSTLPASGTFPPALLCC
jgi:hypothetical protein